MPDPSGLRQVVVTLRLEVGGSTAVRAQVNEQLQSQQKSENPALQ